MERLERFLGRAALRATASSGPRAGVINVELSQGQTNIVVSNISLESSDVFVTWDQTSN